jgi:hypothetical protein
MSTAARLTTLENTMAELAAAQLRTTANLDRLSAEMRDFKAEMVGFKDEMRMEMRAFQEEMRASNREANQRWGELANKMGTMAEDIVAPGIPEMLRRLFGVEDPDWYVRVRRRHRGDPSRRMEFDVVAWAGGHFLATEVRTSARPEDLPVLMTRFAETRDYFPEAEGLGVFGALASFYVDASLIRAAEREGLLVFGLSSGLLELLSSPERKPREF